MQEFDDLRSAVTAALAKIQAGKDAQALLAAEQAAHQSTKDALNALNTDLVKMRNEIVVLKGQIVAATGA